MFPFVVSHLSNFRHQIPLPRSRANWWSYSFGITWRAAGATKKERPGAPWWWIPWNSISIVYYIYIYKFTRFTIHNGQASIWVLATMRLLWFNYTKRIDDKTPLIPIWPLPCRQWANRWSSRLQLNPKSGSPASWRAPAMHTWPAQKEASPAWPVLLFLKCGFGLFNHVSIYMYMYII